MTTDRELMEWAAKAYWGDEIDDVCSIRWLEEDQAIGYTHSDNQDHNGEDREFVWNPLTDDGDALRLAVKLGIGVLFDLQDEIVTAYEQAPYEGYHVEFADEQAPAAATRRAIVRAAASIGQSQENQK